MAKKIRFPLKLAEGKEVRTLEELQEHFALEAVLEYYKSGKLLTWLEDRYLEGEAEAIRALDETSPDFQRQLCAVFQVEYTGNNVDLEEIERRQERLKRLRIITDEAEFIQNIDQVAFDQEELADLLDEGETKIYLCGEKFMVPASRKGITYVGIKNPAVHISGNVPEKPEELGIKFVEVNCDNLPETSVLLLRNTFDLDDINQIMKEDKVTGKNGLTKEKTIRNNVGFIDWWFHAAEIEKRFEELIRQCRLTSSDLFPGLPGEESDLLSMSQQDLSYVAMIFIQDCKLATPSERTQTVDAALNRLYPQYGPIDIIWRETK